MKRDTLACDGPNVQKSDAELVRSAESVFMDVNNRADHNGTPGNRDHIAAPHSIGDLEIDLLTDLSAA